MGYVRYVKGKKAELQLAKLLRGLGFFVMRSPASGRRVRRFIYPDLIAIKKGRVLMFEVKLRKHRDTIHLSLRKVSNLVKAAEIAGGEAFIAVYVSIDGEWYFFRPDNLGIQDHGGSKRYVITVSMYDMALRLGDIVKGPQY